MAVLSPEEQNEWLTQDNTKIIICDIEYHDGTELKLGTFSNYHYIMQHDDSFDWEFSDGTISSISNVAYIDNLINIPTIISKIDSDVNIGTIEFLNAKGEYDDLITYAWEGHPLKLYIGDPSWEKEKFIIILEAVATNISSPRPNMLGLSIRDKKEVFNVKLQEQLITEDYVRTMYADYNTTYGVPAFTEDITNLLSVSVAIEIRLTAATDTTTIPSADIAQLMALVLDAIPEVQATLSSPGSSVVVLTNEMFGAVETAHDGNGDNTVNDTGFTITQTTPGDGSTAEVTNITAINSTANSLESTYFHFHTPYKNFYVWMNVNSNSVDPELIEEAQVGFDPDLVSITFIPETIKNTPVPICLGECFNIEPKLIDSFNHVYQFHEQEVQEVTNVRANGVVLNGPLTDNPQYEVNLILGCIRLLIHQNNTQITCDIVGERYRATGANTSFSIVINSAAHLVEWIAVEKSSLTPSDICPYTFPATIFTNTSPLGLYIVNETEIAPIITKIMQSVGGFSRFHRTCVLQIFRLIDPEPETPSLYLIEDSVIEKGISLGATETPRASITIGYNKNWTVQDKGSLAGLITNETGDFLTELDLYTNEFSSVIASNAGIKDQFPLAVNTDLQETLLSREADATDEVNRRITLRNKKRYVYKLNTIAAPFTTGIGDIIHLTHTRFGFRYGNNCLIIGMEEEPTKQRVNLEVWL